MKNCIVIKLKMTLINNQKEKYLKKDKSINPLMMKWKIYMQMFKLKKINYLLLHLI